MARPRTRALLWCQGKLRPRLSPAHDGAEGHATVARRAAPPLPRRRPAAPIRVQDHTDVDHDERWPRRSTSPRACSYSVLAAIMRPMTDRAALISTIAFALTRCKGYFRAMAQTHNTDEARSAATDDHRQSDRAIWFLRWPLASAWSAAPGHRWRYAQGRRRGRAAEGPRRTGGGPWWRAWRARRDRGQGVHGRAGRGRDGGVRPHPGAHARPAGGLVLPRRPGHRRGAGQGRAGAGLPAVLGRPVRGRRDRQQHASCRFRPTAGHDRQRLRLFVPVWLLVTPGTDPRVAS